MIKGLRNGRLNISVKNIDAVEEDPHGQWMKIYTRGGHEFKVVSEEDMALVNKWVENQQIAAVCF